jgi:hypothetical protein
MACGLASARREQQWMRTRESRPRLHCRECPDAEIQHREIFKVIFFQIEVRGNKFIPIAT